MKSAWFVVVYGSRNVGYMAQAITIGSNKDLSRQGFTEIYFAGTKKDAEEKADKLNKSYRKDDLYYWDKIAKENETC